MSGNPGPLASTKGESTSSKTSKSGYDHLDINKLYKGKNTEPVAKTVTQKHGMQTLGKAPPARRPGNLTTLKSDSTSNDVSSSPSVPPISSSAAPTLGQGQPHPPPGWVNTLPHPPGPPSPHNVPSVPTTGQPVHEKNWSGGPERSGNFPSQRFAQEFPTLDSGGDAPKIPQTNSSGPPMTPSGPQSVLKPHDSQYGPGPILRPQTEGSWIQGGGRNMQRPPGPVPPSNAPARDFGPGPERVLGGPTPPPMSLGQGGPVPPPLGAYPMQFRGMGPPPPYMYQNSGPPGPGGFYPPGPGMPPRYGMPIPPGAPPPPGSHPPDGPRDPGRNRGPPPQLRPGSHFTANPIIKQEDLERMDELAQDGGWASTMDDVDYNKKINFEEEEEERREGGFKAPPVRGERKEEERERRHVNAKGVERQPSISERDHERERDQRFDNREHNFDHPDAEEDWKRTRNNPPYEMKDRERGNRRPRDDDWRSGNNRFDEDRNKKVVPAVINRQDARAAPDFSNKYSNIAPRFLRQQQQGTQQPMTYPQQPPNQRQTPSPVSTNTPGKEREFRDRDWDREPNRDRPPSRDMNFKILERRRVDSETNREGPRDANKRFGNTNEYDSNLRNERYQDKDQSKNSRFGPSDFQRERSKEKESDENKSPNSAVGGSKGGDLERSEQSIESKESSRKQEDSKVSFRGKQEFTSWADEVDDDEFNREAEDSALKKSTKDSVLSSQPKGREFPKSDERDRTGRDFAHRRVYIQQRKVEDMRSPKPEPQPEQKQATEPVKLEKPVDKSKPTSVWGDRENQRERLKQENEGGSQPSKETEAKSPSVEKEIRKSAEKEMSPQKIESQQTQVEQNVTEKIEKRNLEKDVKDNRERRESREKLERVDQKPFERPMPKQESRFDRGPPAPDRMMERDRHDRGIDRNTMNRPNDRDRHMDRGYDRHMGDRSDNRDRDRNDRIPDRDGERPGNRDRNSERPILDRERASANQGDRNDRNRDMHHNREKNKPRRWDNSYDKRDTRTPDRDYNLGRNSESSYGQPMSLPIEKSQHEREKDGEIHKSKDMKPSDKFKSSEKIDSFKDSSLKEKPVSEKEIVSKEVVERDREREREDNRSKDMEKPRENKDVERREKLDRDDMDDRRDNKGQRGGRGRGDRDRGGGAWESSSVRSGTRGGGRGAKTGRGSNSGFYERPPSKRSDSERERDDKDSVKEEPHLEQDVTKDKKEKIDSQEKKDGSMDDVSKSKRDKDKEVSSDSSKKIAKSPSTSKRNMRGASRLQGYGPPSDKIPFSSNVANKDDDISKDKSSDHPPTKQPPQTSGPIPLMELGEISPPNMPVRSRHGYQQGGRGNRNSVPPRLQREEQYPPYNRGSGNGKRGRNNDSAKPLMSLNSNELERGEWETESESDDDSKKNGQGGSTKGKKDSSKGGVTEKYRPNQSQNQNLSRNSAKLSGSTNSEQNNSSNNQDSTNNNSRGGKTSGVSSGRPGGSSVETDSFSGVIGMDSHETADNSDNVDGDSGGFQEVRNKKNFGSKEKGFTTSKAARPDKAVKGRPVKNPPYEARPNQSKDIPPRFLNKAHQQQSAPGGKSTEGNGSFPKETAAPQGNAWEKPITGNLRPEQGSHQSISQSSSMENKDSLDLKMSNVNATMPHVAPKPVASLLDGTNPPVRTVIFENTNLKSGGKFTDVSKNSATSKISDLKKEGNISSALEIGKELPLNFGKVPGENSPELDFGSSPFDDQSNSSQSVPTQQIQHAPPKSMSIAQSSRQSYVSHQPSPISPLAADLNEKIQSVKRVWDIPSMPSVAEQGSVCGSEENSFHGGFGGETFKGTDSSNRDFTQTLQQTSTGYAPGSSPALSAISKPESSSSPNNTTMRQVSQPGKAQQPSGMDIQSHATMSSPFSGYAMQHQGGTAFGGMPAVPSPPTVMYGASQPHLHGGPGVYQTFPHDGPQVLNTNARSQYNQYANAQAANAGPYGLGGSLFLTSIDSSYQPLSVSSYQHQQASQGGPPGQQQNQNNRISPGPLTTSGGGNAGAVMINSTSNSMMNMKSQQGSSGNHPNLSHQVHPGAQQAYSQLSHHHHPAAMGHPTHHMGSVGPNKGGYSQGGITAQTQPQVFLTSFDPSQASVINIGQNYLSTGIRSGPPGGPPPSATPPVQALQASSSYYSGSSGNQTGVYPSGSAQGGALSQLQITVAPGQTLQNLQNASQHFNLQYPSPINIPGYNSQAAATVSALNLGNQLVRPGGHSYMKQGIDMGPTPQLKSSHETLMNQSWNTSFQLTQNFHGGNKTGNISDRNNVNNMNSQRKGNNHMPSMGSMNKYSNPGYPGQKGGGRFSAPGPIQRPISTSPSTGPGGVPSSSHSLPASEST